MIRFHQHALTRMLERGTTDLETEFTIHHGESFEAKYGRVGFRHTFAFGGTWRGKSYSFKQVEAYAVQDGTDWLVISVITKFF